MHEVTIKDADETVIYQQKVERLDLLAVITAINRTPRAPRSDKGKPRKENHHGSESTS